MLFENFKMSKEELNHNVSNLKQDLSDHIKSTTANPYYKVIEKLIGTKNKLALSTFTYCNAMNRIFLTDTKQSVGAILEAKMNFLLGNISKDLSGILHTNNDKVEKILRDHTDDIDKIKQIIEIKNKETFYQIGEEELNQFKQLAKEELIKCNEDIFYDNFGTIIKQISKEEIIKCAEDIICENFSTTIENCTPLTDFEELKEIVEILKGNITESETNVCTLNKKIKVIQELCQNTINDSRTHTQKINDKIKNIKDTNEEHNKTIKAKLDYILLEYDKILKDITKINNSINTVYINRINKLENKIKELNNKITDIKKSEVQKDKKIDSISINLTNLINDNNKQNTLNYKKLEDKIDKYLVIFDKKLLSFQKNIEQKISKINEQKINTKQIELMKKQILNLQNENQKNKQIMKNMNSQIVINEANATQINEQTIINMVSHYWMQKEYQTFMKSKEQEFAMYHQLQ